MENFKKEIKKSIVALSFSLLTLSSIPIHVSADLPKSMTSTAVSPRKEDIRWVYKKEGNAIYKRLYNFTTQVWIGDWIFVNYIN